jgi:HD-GYP domain-containing protein (c-di-GMP phosphodiesterase class II)
MILRKPGPLNDEEWAEMRRHPEIGARILGSSEFDDLREWVLSHHERPDGRGYPRGLRGEDMTLEAKILAVADAYEAMTSDRVYRPAIGREAAREELRRGSGSQFDPLVVEAFLAVLDKASAALHAS